MREKPMRPLFAERGYFEGAGLIAKQGSLLKTRDFSHAGPHSDLIQCD
jgi:hypothetical protein